MVDKKEQADQEDLLEGTKKQLAMSVSEEALEQPKRKKSENSIDFQTVFEKYSRKKRKILDRELINFSEEL